jgi:hypothetical protein
MVKSGPSAVQVERALRRAFLNRALEHPLYRCRGVRGPTISQRSDFACYNRFNFSKVLAQA